MTRATKITTGIRWILTTAILIQVWQHAHWSVAGILTVLAIRSEVIAFTAESAAENIPFL